jgi:hypothetical protein
MSVDHSLAAWSGAFVIGIAGVIAAVVGVWDRRRERRRRQTRIRY